jgi:outer membrane protein OmpA-like peptidoglycan-associated protein
VDDALHPKPAAEFITQAFDRFPLVALSELHGNVDTKEFLARLIRTPGFAGTVNDIAIEFGNARYQDVLDRYIAGETVTREALKPLWEDTTQVSGIWSLPLYEEILADIRAVNSALPPAQRFRVLAGDPPIDWSTVTSPADDDMNDWRDAHYAWVVERHVRDLRRKALLFVGGAHISRKVVFPNSLIHLLDARYPGQTLVVSVVDVGSMDPSIATSLRAWTPPAAALVRGTWLGRSDVQMVGAQFSRGSVEDDVDAILYVSALPLVLLPPPRDEPQGARSDELRRRRRLADQTLPFRGARIRFEPSRTTLSPQSSTPLQLVRDELLRDSSLGVLVKGFADVREPDSMQLSAGRAAVAIDWLTARGIARQRLEPLACGATRPLWTDDEDPEHHAMHRRVDIVRKTPTAGCQPPSSFELPGTRAAALRTTAGYFAIRRSCVFFSPSPRWKLLADFLSCSSRLESYHSPGSMSVTATTR